MLHVSGRNVEVGYSLDGVHIKGSIMIKLTSKE